ncbi:MAG: ABC transporter ATP-binding protein [Phycisphaerae bacterium]
MSKTLIQADGVCKTYQLGRSLLKVLRGATFKADPGEFVAIMGASGSGKSTLLHILGALDLPDQGGVQFEGRSVFDLPRREQEHLRNTDVGFVFQFYHLLPELNVFENILLPHMVGHSLLGWASAARRCREMTREVIQAVGLSERIRHKPSELSGGERQRAAIARAIVNRPKLLLADEPTGNLDAKTGEGILEVLGRLHRDGQTIIMVTHDANIAKRADRVLQLVEGRIRPT